MASSNLELVEKGELEAPVDKLLSVEDYEKEAGGDESDPTVKYRGWKAMPYVIGNETFEKLGTLGTVSNLLVYLTTVFHMNSASAATLLQIYGGTTNLGPILGAYLSDAHLGRYATLAIACVASLLGMVILTLTAAFSKLHPPSCNNGGRCTGPSPLQLSILFLSFAFLAVGAGGIRPCNLAFGADQFDPRTESGRKGINSFFNWYYFTFTVAVMISSTVIIYIQSNISWALGLAIPALLMFLSCSFFFLGTKLYVIVKPEGSPFTNVARVLAAAYAKRKLRIPDDDKSTLSFFNPPQAGDVFTSRLPHTNSIAFRWLDKASIITNADEIGEDGKASNPWRLCSLQHVEEVKSIVRTIPVWSAGMFYFVALTQNGTYTVFQALQSNRHLGKSSFQIPAGSFSVFNMLALTIWIPIYDRLIVPRLQRLTGVEGGITLLQRIGIGMVISVFASLVAAIVEGKRRRSSSSHDAVSSMSSLWLIPQLTLCGLSEAFSMIGQNEFYYKQFPENMRSVGAAFLFFGFAVANYVCSLMVMVVERTTGGGRENWLASDLNEGRLDHFYFLNAAIATASFVYFIICAKWYKYKDLKEQVPDQISMETKKKLSL